MVEVAIAAFAACLNDEERTACMPPVTVEVVEAAEELPPTFCEAVNGEDESPAADTAESSAAESSAEDSAQDSEPDMDAEAQ
jgi:hypothetical protein